MWHITPDPSHPVYIFDIDGTLADITHRLHLVKKGPNVNGGPDHPDYEAFHDACVHDVPIWPVIQTAKDLARTAYVVMVTGRMEPWREHTLKWLLDHGVPCNGLFMRPAGDHQPDFEIKRDLYHEHLAGLPIVAVFDDRTRVVEMWRSLGLTCFQVANGDY